MRLGQGKPIRIEYEGDVITFVANRTYGNRRAYMKALSSLSNVIDGTDGEKVAAGEAIEAISRKLIADCVLAVSGIEDDAGEPVPWSPDLVDALPTDVAEDLIRALAGQEQQFAPKAEVDAEGNAE